MLVLRMRAIGARRVDAERRRAEAQAEMLRTARALRDRGARGPHDLAAGDATPPLDH